MGYLILFCLLTGNLIKEIMIPKTELACTNRNTWKTLFVPVLFKEFSQAMETCDKFLPNSIADNFLVTWGLNNKVTFQSAGYVYCVSICTLCFERKALFKICIINANICSYTQYINPSFIKEIILWIC